MCEKDAARSGSGSESDEPGAVGADEASDLSTSFAIKLRKALDAAKTFQGSAAREEQARDGDSLNPRLEPGADVIIAGLMSRLDLNGQQGTVKEYC